ncbi:MAG: competence/damage-inducible protein A [Clostridia bacterium]|nr:competence/damage-inducible protein A [Clostridia bacterium]
MNFEIISVGTELLLGQIVNTNAQVISRMLGELGMNVYYTTVVGDNPQRLRSALEIAAGRADGIITTGGLGPTGDDLTKETIADFCGLKCVMHQESLDRLKARFAGRKTPMPKNNLKQAEMPEGCIVLNNENGTAPGAIIEHKENIFIMLPGPPSEMKPMLYEKVRPYLEKKTDYVIHSKSLRIFGVGESAAEEKLKDIMERQTNPSIAPYAKIGEMEFRLTARAHSVEEAEKMIAPLEKEVRDIIGDFIYAEGEEANLQKTVVELLIDKGLKITTAESCTGGLIAKKLTEVSGASEVFHAGFVTYSNEEKEKLLGVSHKTLEEYGAVSEQTALEMSKGSMERANADIGIGITGIAGPTGGTKEKPVGLVYISICAKDCHKAYKLQLNGSREVVRERASLYVLDMVRRYVIGRLNADYIW